jgi:N-acetylmuramoyl-L-alanine amidase
VNFHSIGIELANDGTTPFPEPQMAALERLLPPVLHRWDIGPEGVIGHSDMAPGRKVDPGPRFDWRRLALRGLALWPGVAGPGAFDEDLAAIGYRLPEGAEAGLLLAAFRMRFRPWARGPLSEADRQAARALAARVG